MADLGLAGKKVAMLVNNSCVYDSRVIKSAETMASLGCSVTVVCRGEVGLADNELRNEVRYRRVQKKSLSIGYCIHSLGRAISGQLLAISLPVRFITLTCWGVFKRAIILATRVTKSSAGVRIFKPHNKPSVDTLKNKGAQPSHHLKNLLRDAARSAYKSLEHDEVNFVMRGVMRSIEPDIIHAHDLGTLSAGVAFAREHGAKLIYDSHELEMHRNTSVTKCQAKRRRAEEARGISVADSVITVSKSIATHLASDYGIGTPTVIFNAPKKPFGLPYSMSENFRYDAGFTTNDPCGVYVGGVTIDRGLENILQAMVIWPEFKFATVGPKSPMFTKQFLGMARELGVSDRLRCLDPVSTGQVVQYVASADFSVLPLQNVCLSYYYCMPNKLFESVLAGLPVAVSNLKDMTEFVDHWQCGLAFDETDPVDIATTLKSLYAERDTYRLSGDRLDKFARLCSWEAQGEKLERIYRKLAAA